MTYYNLEKMIEDKVPCYFFKDKDSEKFLGTITYFCVEKDKVFLYSEVSYMKTPNFEIIRTEDREKYKINIDEYIQMFAPYFVTKASPFYDVCSLHRVNDLRESEKILNIFGEQIRKITRKIDDVSFTISFLRLNDKIFFDVKREEAE